MDPKLIACSKKISIFNENIHEEIFNFDYHKSYVYSCKWYTNDSIISCGKDGKVFLKNFKYTSPINIINSEDKSYPICLDIGYQNKLLVTGHSNNKMKIFDLSSKKIIKSLEEHTSLIKCLSFSPNENLLVSGSKIGTILVNDVKNNYKNINIFEKKNYNEITSLNFSPFNYSNMLSSSTDGTIDIYDLEKAKPELLTFNLHKLSCMNAKYSPTQDKLICSIGLDKKINLIDLSKKKPLVKYFDSNDSLTSFTFSNCGTNIYIGTYTGFIFKYDLRKSSSYINKYKSQSASCINFIDFFNPNKVNNNDISKNSIKDNIKIEQSQKPKINNFFKEEKSILIKQNSKEDYELSNKNLKESIISTSQVKKKEDKKYNNIEKNIKEYINKEMNSWHIEIIKQFHFQQMELKGMIQDIFKENLSLKDKVKSLTEENQKLKEEK